MLKLGVITSWRVDPLGNYGVLTACMCQHLGLFIENAANVARRELSWEVDYERERWAANRFRDLLADDPNFFIPGIEEGLSSKRVITSELIQGASIDSVAKLDQETRNNVSMRMLELCLRELFEFRFMQTDPNWSNYFYDPNTDQIILLDFGATREYDKDFVDSYIKVIHAAAVQDREAVEHGLIKLGFVTGYEAKVGFIVKLIYVVLSCR